jgi:drug/metabolite transporter (DMT)-like permease
MLSLKIRDAVSSETVNTDDEENRVRSWIFLFLCNLMWALQFTCVKLVQAQVGPLFTVWGPMTLATIMLYPLLRWEQESGAGPKRRSDIILFLTLALVAVFPAQVFITLGTRLSTASNAAIIVLAVPVFTAVFAYFFLGERMTAIRWLCFVIAITGVLLCSQTNLRSVNFRSNYLVGNLLVAAGTLGSAIYNSYGKKVLRRYSPLEMLFCTYLGMLVIMTPLVLSKEPEVFRRIPEFTKSTWAGLMLLTLFHYYLSMVLFLKALRKLDATQAALSNYLIPLFGVPIAAITLGERLNTASLVGGALVLASTLLVTLWPGKHRGRSAVTSADTRA